MRSCYEGRIDAVGLAGNLPDTILRTLSMKRSLPIVLIDNIMDFGDHPPAVDVQFRHKLQVFIIEVSSYQKLDTLIEMNIKNSIWWNHMAAFYLLDLSFECVRVNDFLFIAWQRNILDARVICNFQEFNKVVFTHNPFVSEAPDSWHRLYDYPGINHHPFTVFAREFRVNDTMCENFDKTQNLGGYMIRVEGIDLGLRENDSLMTTSGRYQYWSVRERIFHTIFRALNAEARLTGLERWSKYLEEDIEKNSCSMHYTWNASSGIMTTYPHAQIGRIIVSQFRGHKSQLEKILTVIDVDSRFGVGVVYVITFIFLFLFVNQSPVPALLNLIRITCNAGFTNLPNSTAVRIFLASLLCFVITMQGIFQGDLASLLTKNIPRRNVNTVKDLIDLGYKKVYGHSNDRIIFKDSELDKEYIVADNASDCLTHVKHDSSAACVCYAEGALLDVVREANLHVSSEFVVKDHVAFKIRWNWSLEQRVNTIIARMVESRVLEPWNVKCNPVQLSDFYEDALVKNNRDFKKLELCELIFAFVILGIGLACATIVFIIETATQYKCICNYTCTWVCRCRCRFRCSFARRRAQN